MNTPFGPLAGAAAHAPADRCYWVVEGRLLAGAYPFAADEGEGTARLDWLLRAGVSAFVDLTQAHLPGSTDSFLLDYREALARLDPAVPHLRRPIRDLDVPPVAEMQATLAELDRLLGAGETPYVHCWGGIGRTGTVIGCWLVRHGVPPGAAIDLLSGLRRQEYGRPWRRSPETEEQVRYVEGWREG
jgi:hypothetical protein